MFGMKPDAKSLYKAFLAHDPRFDGLFYVAVTSTRIYCRPICPVKPPKEVNCRSVNASLTEDHQLIVKGEIDPLPRRNSL